MGFTIAIIDYEMGNLKSIQKCLNYLDVQNIITADPKVIIEADGIILPGVGAFGVAMKNLLQKNLIEVINQIALEKKPLLGICLGLQLLFSKSEEMGEFKGLNLINGKVTIFPKNVVVKIPHIGWNSVDFTTYNHFLIERIPNNSYFYFAHSYFAIPDDSRVIIGVTEYGDTEFASIIANNNILATQFHPEKSGKVGISLFKNFINYCKK